jgi:uncharacterized membrane protein YadS
MSLMDIEVGGIAAIGPLVRAEEDDVLVAIALVSVLGTIGVVTYPSIAAAFHLATPAYALLCGSTLHEVPQVLAAAFARGQEAGDFGTLVKLTRVALLAPLALALSALETAHGGARITWRNLPVPWFVVGFVAVGALRSLGLVPAALIPVLDQLSRVLLVAAMAAVGFGVNLRSIKAQMGMDVLRCKTPDMVKKEVAVHLLAYTLARAVMAQAASLALVLARALSFKGATQILDAYHQQLRHSAASRTSVMIAHVLGAIALLRLPVRPGRVEPRAIKRRPKPHRLLTVPRDLARLTLIAQRKRLLKVVP